MTVRKYGWSKNVAMAFQRMGTTTDARHCKQCSFCDAHDLPEIVVLLKRNIDGDIEGNSYACEKCAAEVTLQAVAEKHGGPGVNPNDDPNLQGGRSSRRRR